MTTYVYTARRPFHPGEGCELPRSPHTFAAILCHDFWLVGGAELSVESDLDLLLLLQWFQLSAGCCLILFRL